MKVKTGLRKIDGNMKMCFVPNGARFELLRFCVVYEMVNRIYTKHGIKYLVKRESNGENMIMTASNAQSLVKLIK